MKKLNGLLVSILAISFILFIAASSYGQGEEKVVKKPVTGTFEGGMLIENPTIVNPRKGGIQLIINHRFGTVANGWDDIFGIYAPSNIYMGVNYGILDKLSVGFASEKNNKYQEFHLKWNILNQHRANGSPIAITYYGSFSIDAHKKEFFGSDYEFTKRLSYFNQIIFSRKFSDKVSLQLSPSFSHFNAVDTAYIHNVLGIAFGGKYVLWNMNSLILDFSYPIAMDEFPGGDDLEPKPNLGLGVEFVTGTHVFQVFFSNFDQLIPQRNYMYNQHDLTMLKDYLLGFNILVRLN